MARRARVRSGARAHRKAVPAGRAAEASVSTSHPLLQLQRTIGNRAVGRLLAQRAPEEGAGRPSGFATISLEKQGELEGESREPGYEGKIAMLGFSLEARPREQQDPKEKPPVEAHLTKSVDTTSARLMKAYIDGEKVESALFEWVRADDQGKLSTVHAMEMHDAMIANVFVAQATEVVGLEGKMG